MKITLLRRFIAYTCFGFLLLVIYQIVFMARTSAGRDWNHLHSAKFSLASLQRQALNLVNETNVAHLTEHFRRSSVNKRLGGFKQKSSHLPKHSAYIAQLEFSPPIEDIISEYSPVFGYKHSADPIVLQQGEVRIAAFSSSRSVQDEIDAAITEGRKALIYVCPEDWIPNYGFKLYDLPVVALRSAPGPFQEVKFVLKDAGTGDSRSLEWHVPGFTADTLVVSDSRSSPESSAIFFEVARTFEALLGRGWRPLRSVHFVSHGQYSAPQWSQKNKGWLQRRATAFIDCGQLSDTPSLAVSPALNQTAQWAIDQLVEAKLLPEVATTIPSGPLGTNAVNFDLKVPSISAKFCDSKNTARLIALLAVTLAQDAILPFYAIDYLPYFLDSRGYEVAALVFDRDLDTLRFEFTSEYPWYQGMKKFKALVKRKHANLIVRRIEQHLRSSNGDHVLFEGDKAGIGTVVRTNRTEIGPAIMAVVDDFHNFL